MLLKEEREQVVEYGKQLLERNLSVGTFGNISIYNEKENLFAISPSGMDYYKTTPEDVVICTPEGEKVEGTAKPSSELDMHRIFYQKRPEIKAVVHTHSRYAVTLATMGKSIPPMHYLIAYSGREVPCTPYKTIGSYELACAGNISYAMDIAEQIEFVANIYYNTLLAGGPKMLKDEDIDVVLEAFKTYRQR